MTTTTSTTSTATSATASTSTTAKLVATLGGSSGIDMASLAEQLSTAQYSSRIDRLTTKNDKLTTQISAASTIKSMVLSIATSLGDRVRTGDLAVTPSIANASVATVTKGVASASGSYQLEVTAIAKGQTLTSPPLAASTSTVGSGSLKLRFGTVSGTGFTEDTTHTALDITVAAGATLADVASQINAAGAGVTAYVATGSSGAQLVLKGKEGAANGFTLEATEDPADPGLAALAWTPAGDATRLKSTAVDAAYQLDGVSRTSPSNTIEDAAPGLTLKLTGTNAGAPTTVSFSDPTSAITTAMSDLTSALNEIMSELKIDTDPTSGSLSNDPGARALKRAMAGLALSKVMPNAATGAPSTMADLGLVTQRDGTFTLDATRLAATLKADPAGAAAMFTNGLYGVFGTIDTISRSVTSATDANSLAGSIKRYTTQQTDIGTQKTTLSTKQEALRSTLVTRYAALDTRLSASKSTLSFLQAQIDAWNAKTN